ncbi:hypothetical protein KEM56_005761 [Ascosphaera pollenicola]|nr:hypothetical protein KEM56_005761 [Ascosphaera pollenicola]
MDDKPSKKDSDLLDRLNALKPSTVQLEKRHELYDDLDDQDDQNETPFDLTARFAGLRMSPSSSSRLQQDNLDINADLGDDLENLLSELRAKSSDQVKDELRGGENVDNLLKDAKQFVKKSSKLQDEAKELDSIRDTVPQEDRKKSQTLTEEEEAEEYLQNVLTDLKKEGLGNAQDEGFPSPTDDESKNKMTVADQTPDIVNGDHAEAEITPIDLPTVPSTTSFLPSSSVPPSNELSPLNLPSAPTNNPVSAEHREAVSNSARKKEEPTWCCICSDDATIRCLDCESEQLFCLRCWVEYHLTEGGYEERSHRRERYAKGN